VRQADAVSPVNLPAPDPAASAEMQQVDYRIGPMDTLEITVFEVDNLKLDVQVDAAGQIDFPLVGQVSAIAKTPRQLGDDISKKLGERYLQDPKVNVFVKEAVSQRFTVEGAVKKPGVFPSGGRMTLLQAVATAEGLENVANSKSVVVFRTVNQKRMAATVNLNEIRTGKFNDPQIYAGDMIVVALSKSRRTLQDIIGLTPVTSAALLLGL